MERIPSRILLSSRDSDLSGYVSLYGKNSPNKVEHMSDTKEVVNEMSYIKDVASNGVACTYPSYEREPEKNVEYYEETLDTTYCCDEEKKRYTNKIVKFIVDFEECLKEVIFESDKEMVLTDVELENVYDFKILVNGELMSLDNEIRILEGDEITVRISRDDDFKRSKLSLVGYDPNEVVDNEYIAESPLDEQVGEEDIYVENNDEE